MNIAILHEYFLKSSGACTDTRNITDNCIFFALKGENFNGNLFASEALESGAMMAIVDEKPEKENKNIILFDDVLETLQQLATFHRNFLGTKIIALTGSNGKTTTKELINAVLSEKYSTTATKGNLNNHIGVPLTLLAMNEKTDIGIVEMGANHLEEINTLCEIARPDYGYITNFGKAHLEGFGSLQGVIKGKTEMYRFLKKKSAPVFINGYDPIQITQSEGMETIIFGNEYSDCHITLIESTKELKIGFKEQIIQSNLIGNYNYPNIAAAIAIGNYFGVTAKEINKGIEKYIPQNNRSQIMQLGSKTIIMDAYNANPTSMLAALANLKQSEGKNKICFLGDMFELGESAKIEHQTIVDYLNKNKVGKVYLVGYNFYSTKSKNKNIQKFETFDDLRKHIQNKSFEENLILIKGSRGMALERILDIFK